MTSTEIGTTGSFQTGIRSTQLIVTKLLGTPLTTIEGYAEMLKEWALHDEETAQESVDAIQEESKRMRAMVESLLALAQGDEGAPLELESQDLRAVGAEAVRTAWAAVGSNISVKYRPPKREVVAIFDPTRIR